MAYYEVLEKLRPQLVLNYQASFSLKVITKQSCRLSLLLLLFNVYHCAVSHPVKSRHPLNTQTLFIRIFFTHIHLWLALPRPLICFHLPNICVLMYIIPLQMFMAICSGVCAQICCGYRAERYAQFRSAVQAGSRVWLGSDQAGQLCEENRSHHQDPAASYLPRCLQDR